MHNTRETKNRYLRLCEDDSETLLNALGTKNPVFVNSMALVFRHILARSNPIDGTATRSRNFTTLFNGLYSASVKGPLMLQGLLNRSEIHLARNRAATTPTIYTRARRQALLFLF